MNREWRIANRVRQAMAFQGIGILLIALAFFAAPYDVAVAVAPGWHIAVPIVLGSAGLASVIVGTLRRS